MWNRFWSMVRSWFGALIRKGTNPEMVLRQLKDDLEDQIPKMNANAAKIVAEAEKWQAKKELAERQIATIKPQVENAAKLGPEYEEAALNLINKLEEAEAELKFCDENVQDAQKAAAEALETRKAYETQVKRKIAETEQLISRLQRADLKREFNRITSTAFEVNDHADTLKKMQDAVIERESLAKGEARVADESVESKIAKVEAMTTITNGKERLEEIRRQLGVTQTPLYAAMPEVQSKRTMDCIEVLPQQ